MKNVYDYDNLSMLTMSLAHLLHAGVAVPDALWLLAEDAKDSEILQKMAENADSGMSLAQCFQNSGVFPGYLCTLLAVGEKVGKTEQTLTRLAQYYDGQARLKRQLRSALLYPAILLAVLLAVFVVLLVWVLPIFDSVYAQLGGSLTGIAGGLLNFGKLIGKALPWIGVALALLFAVFAVPFFRKSAMKLWKKLWGDQGVWKYVNNGRFVQALSLGIVSGMTQPEAVQMASGMAKMDVPKFKLRCEQCAKALEQGEKLSSALEKVDFLTAAEGRLLDAGIRSGQGEVALSQLADRLLEQSEEKVAGLTEKAEPAAVILACSLTGLVLLSVMLPLLNIMNTIG